MSYTRLTFGDAARSKILAGATALADAVRPTLGPKSRSILIERKWGAPHVCNDGVTIAKLVHLQDPEENLGAQTLRQAAERTGDAVGDGTTTATILAHALFADGLRNVVAGASAVDVKRGFDRGAKVAVDALKALSRPVANRQEKVHVATISAHNDAVIGELVADAIERVGGEGVTSARGGEGHRDDARGGRGHAARPRLPLAVLRHPPREDAGSARRPLDPARREADQRPPPT